MVWSNSTLGTDSNDKIDIILEFIMNMSNKMDKLTGTVDKLSETEEISVMKVVKLEDAVQKMKKEMGEMKQTMDSSKEEMEQKMNTNKEEINSKMEKIEADVKSERFPFGWTFLGRGVEISHDYAIAEYHKSFTDCVNMCEHKRSTDGSEWNGLQWSADNQWCRCSKNDRGHRGNSLYVHFRLE